MAEKIDDFGRVIHGAAKHKARQWIDRAALVSDDTTAREPLSKSFPVPDYADLVENGHDPFKIGLIRALRDAIPDKPRGRKAVHLPGWVASVSAIRNVCIEFMENDEITRVDLDERLKFVKSSVLPHVILQAEAYAEVGHAISLNNYHMIAEVRMGQPGEKYRVCRSEGNFVREEFGRFETKEEAKAAFFEAVRSTAYQAQKLTEEADGQKAAPAKKKQAAPKLYTSPVPGGVKLIAKVNRMSLDLGKFTTTMAAVVWARENMDAIQERIAAARNNPEQRRETNTSRVGPSRRRGHVTPEDFREVFGNIGGQFGESLPADERQAALNNAHDSLLDLAEVLGVEPKSLLLNGQLGLAFGARGKGGKGAAAAHYEPGEMVINLTRRNGAGCFAHEWFHALDHAICMRAGGARDGFMTQNVMPVSETKAVQRGFVEAFNKHPVNKRSVTLDMYRSDDYYGTLLEMGARGFEALIVDRLAQRGQTNDWLANIMDRKSYDALNALCGRQGDLYPYPDGEAELEPLRAPYEAVIEEAIRLGILEPAVVEPEVALEEQAALDAEEPASEEEADFEEVEFSTPSAMRRQPEQLSFGW